MTEPIYGGQAVVEALKNEDVRHVFGLIGSATMEVFDGLYEANSIRFVGVHDERTGTHMADGYARASGGPGVIVAGQNGPGATNLLTGLAQASAAYSPVVAIAGALSSAHVYRDAFQEVDQHATLSPVTKSSVTVPSVDRIPELFQAGFRTALTPRRGPVLLNVPRNVQSAKAAFPEPPAPDTYRVQYAPAAPAAAVERAAQMLLDAERPVIVAGGGIKNGGGAAQTLALAELLNAPVAMSPGHGDAIPFGHPLNAGQMGPRGNPVASRLVLEADVILALGTRLGFNSTFYSYDNINRDAEIIQIEIEPTEIGRHFPVSLGIWADAPTVADQLAGAVRKAAAIREATQWTAQFQAERKAFLARRDAEAVMDETPIQPSGLFRAYRRVLPRNAAIVLDAGTMTLQATDALEYWEPPCLFTPLDFGLVGFSFACGLGVKAAQPDRPVVSFAGDGGFGMQVSELSTAVDHGLNTVAVVMNNGCWGAEKAYQRDFFGGRYIGADVGSPPFDELARLYGAAGYRVERLSEVEDAIAAALDEDRPAVVDIKVDPDALYSFRRDSFAHRM
ncbi:MAG: thiamine pyrophosphate-binding protein [Rhodospirillaceae bacterium]|nr:thiamine pyrophosphate-binding protein [Rhodospirillaceae bacterium]MYF87690.1 thiamine pyrophosphate-binding protein [Rhodospirillaceae bacterium]MYH36429.1 thiamine pyrophosphate-binding protein [Rhodospirillaceae bacterium]MYK16429.1 thiamine pyrophosphate-binding protein [Rhodospirillaceae bacterium]MYK57635.1 thiamine pyrophosphate-binding protein [Rhodospirillaceae bacterium]